ncbi:TonB C-terminal domain-containing protein [Rhizobium leguminosarum]|uniref:TonB C-terminal domain-containing protein n=1 Tax=Rhizobium leguminosarum TaxID=384 RepID=UPI001AE2B943|nr:TonB C-terminal domain-containing protein [Rhizobium leguminosarum]MBP2443908.1 membrane protein involved in colicin uptake [Rhizobium leguminosarum]
MLMDLSHGKTAAATLSAILACALDASAQSTSMATSDKLTSRLHQAVASHFNAPPELWGPGKVVIEIHLRLDHTGAIVGSPEVTAAGGSEAARKSLSAAALRAVLRSSPFPMLPKDKYESRKEVVLRFETGDPTP